jgi:hypothetical protein
VDGKSTQNPSKGYGKHSKKYWLVVYLIVAVVVYGLIYLAFMHKGGSSSGSSFKY